MKNFIAVTFINNEARNLLVHVFKLPSFLQHFLKRALMTLDIPVTAILSLWFSNNLRQSKQEQHNWFWWTKVGICPSWERERERDVFLQILISASCILWSLFTVTVVWWFLAPNLVLKCWELNQFKTFSVLMNNYNFNKKVMSHFQSTKSAKDFKLGMFRSSWGLDLHVTVGIKVILLTLRFLKGSYSRCNICRIGTLIWNHIKGP